MKYLFFLLLVGCGITVHTDPVTVNPVTIKVQYSIDTDQITNFCNVECNNDTTCESNCYKDLLNTITGVTNGTN